MFIEIHVYTDDICDLKSFFVYDTQKMQFSHDYANEHFESPVYLYNQSYSNLILYSSHTCSFCDKLVESLTKTLSVRFDCIVETFTTMPRMEFIYERGCKRGAVTDEEKHVHDEAFYKRMDKERHIRTIYKEAD